MLMFLKFAAPSDGKLEFGACGSQLRGFTAGWSLAQGCHDTKVSPSSPFYDHSMHTPKYSFRVEGGGLSLYHSIFGAIPDAYVKKSV